MKRPASDMTRESNCAYTRGRSRRLPLSPSLPSLSRPLRLRRPLAVSSLSTLRRGLGARTTAAGSRSNFIRGPFGILDRPGCPERHTAGFDRFREPSLAHTLWNFWTRRA